MHGQAEHKVPDGKLLRADVFFDEDIDAVELHGDFFIYPEAALDDIEDAFAGMDTDAAPDTLTDAVEDAIPDGTELVGFTPLDVATVVAEAVHNA